jgi:hypothetical protein
LIVPNLDLSTLNELSAKIVARALFNLLFVPIIFERIFVYPASSKTERNADQAFRPVPADAGSILMIAALYLNVVSYGTLPHSVIGITFIFLYASFVAFLTAICTSHPLETPRPIFPFLLPTRIIALKDNCLPQVLTLVTLLTSNRSSSNSFFGFDVFTFSGVVITTNNN